MGNVHSVGGFRFKLDTLHMRGTLLVAQMFEVLRYKQEGCGFDSRWCHWNLSLT